MDGQFDQLTGSVLTAALVRDEETCREILNLCGLIDEAGKVLNPYTRNTDADTYLSPTTDGRLGLRWFWNEDGVRKSARVTMAQVYRDYIAGLHREIQAGRDGEHHHRKLGKVEGAIWLLRAAYDAQLLTLPPTTAQPLPAGAPGHVQAVYSSVDLVDRLRRRYDPGNITFTAAARFLVDWTGLSEAEVVSAKRWFVTRGYWLVVQRGEPYKKGRYGGLPTTYCHGTAEDIRARSGGAENKDIDQRRQQAEEGAAEDQGGGYKNIPGSYEELQLELEQAGKTI